MGWFDDLLDDVFDYKTEAKKAEEAAKKAASRQVAAQKAETAKAAVAAQEAVKARQAQTELTAKEMAAAKRMNTGALDKSKGVDIQKSDVKKIKRKGVSALKISKSDALGTGDPGAGGGVFVPM